jgi:hypothetical protein
MERLFSPCTRYRDIAESEQGRLEEFSGPPEWLQELNLDVSTEALVSAERAFTYADLYAMLENGETVAWLTPHASVVRAGDGSSCLQSEYKCLFNADDKQVVASARSPEHLLEICDVILRLLAVSVVHSVILHQLTSPYFLINAPSLAYLMEQCQSLKVLSLKEIALDEDHCRVLGACVRPGLEVELK